jgi:glycosyltransferase involved in cell wall biosynthesis
MIDTASSGRRNVLWVVDHLGYGELMHGPGKYYLNMIPMFTTTRFNLTLCVLRGLPHLYSSLEKRGFKVYHLQKGKFNPFTLQCLLKIIRTENISLIHTHGYGSANFGRVAGILMRLPTIIGAYDEDPYYPWYQRLSDYVLNTSTSKAIAVSEAVKKSCIKKRRIPASKILVMHTGISPDLFEKSNEQQTMGVKESYQIMSNHFVVGTLSRLRQEKGITYLIQAIPTVLQAIPNTYFFIAGDGPLLNELTHLANRLGVSDRVIFAGFCKDAKAILSIFDIKVLASITEGFSAAIQEAMAMQKPIVATDVGGTTEMIKDGVTGLLVPPKDPNAMAQKIIYLLQRRDERDRLATAAYKESRKWGLDVLVKDLERLYEEVLIVTLR